MEIKFPWWQPVITGAEMPLLKKVIDSNFLNEGQFTRTLEENLAGLLGARHAIAMTSGTTAIFAVLAALDIGHGDEVIIPNTTFIATAHAVILAGATPVLADADAATLCLDAAACAKAVTARTKAIIPVHVSGRSADMEALLAVAEEHGLHLVEDAAEAMFSRAADGRALGTLGIAGCYSLSPNKIIGSGQGGLVVTDDDGMAARLREIKDQGRPVRGTGGGDDAHPTTGYNFKYTNLQAAVALAQLDHVEERAGHQRMLRRLYGQRLDALNGLYLPPFDLDGGELPLWIDALSPRRDALIAYLRERGADCRPIWRPLHSQPAFAAPDEDFPNSRMIGDQGFWLPSALVLSEADVHAICDMIVEFFGETGE